MKHTHWLTALLVILVAPLVHALDLNRTFNLNIPAQSLSAALIELSKQTQLQIMSQGNLVQHTTRAITGSYTIAQALEELLEGTDLQYSATGDNTIAVMPVAVDSSVANQVLADVRVAQEEGGSSAQKSASGSEEEPQGSGVGDEGEVEDIPEVVVTGTYIRGISAVGAKVLTVDRNAIQQGGFLGTQDIVRSIPQNFGGGPSEDNFTGIEAASNSAFGTGVNLRGLGSGSTLVLLDGHRLASGGNAARFVDVSNIPISIIERVEVLSDGASALYGSDAVGGVVNFISRKDFDGAETALRIDSLTEGNSQSRQFSQLLGMAWDEGRAFISYEFTDEQPLRASDRPFVVAAGQNFASSFSNPGTILVADSTTGAPRTWAIPSGQDGRSLDPANLVEGTQNLRNLAEDTWLLPKHRMHSVFGKISQDVATGTALSAQFLVSKRDVRMEIAGLDHSVVVPASNPFYVNPTGGTGAITVQYNFTNDLGPITSKSEVTTYGSMVGLKRDVAFGWSVTADVELAREEQDNLDSNSLDPVALRTAVADPNAITAFNPFADGTSTSPATLDAIRLTGERAGVSELRASQLVLDGPLPSLWSGTPRLAVGGQYRDYTFRSKSRQYSSTVDLSVPERNGRDVRAAFAELYVPLVDGGDAMRGVRSLSLSLAGRYERYDDFGSEAVPRIGVSWVPVNGLIVRGAWSKSFKAPNLADTSSLNNQAFISRVPDPQAGGARVPVLMFLGGNPNLEAERATSWTAGIDYAVPGNPGTTFSLGYFDIDFRDRIESPLARQPFSTLLQDPALSDVVIRNPTGEQRAAACAHVSVFFALSPESCVNQTVAAMIDGRTGNTAISRTRGIDLQGTWRLAKRGANDLSLGLNATFTLDFSRALLSSSPLIELVSIQNNPVDLRLIASVSWDRGRFSSSVFANYTDAYKSISGDAIDSWTTADLRIGYELPFRAGLLQDTVASLHVQDLLNQAPPFISNVSVGYDSANADPRGRVVSLQLRKSWRDR